MALTKRFSRFEWIGNHDGRIRFLGNWRRRLVLRLGAPG